MDVVIEFDVMSLEPIKGGPQWGISGCDCMHLTASLLGVRLDSRKMWRLMEFEDIRATRTTPFARGGACIVNAIHPKGW